MKTLNAMVLTLALSAGSYQGFVVGWTPQAHASGDLDEHEHEHEHEKADEVDEDKHGHDNKEEGRTKIDMDAAKAAGLTIDEAGSGVIQEMIMLTGRIMLNRNTTAEVRARFPGVVKNVTANWGDKVLKGQPLATIEANKSLKNYIVRAPTNGVILTRNTNVGNVTGDEPLFMVADLSEVWAEFHVFPRDLAKVTEQLQVRIHTLENTREVEAPITLILPTADPLSQTIIAVVSIPNEEGKWRPGMTVEGSVHVSQKRVPLAVREEAVQRINDSNVVFVKEGDVYEIRAVKLGKSDGTYVEILKGLKAGEQYVSQGSFIVKADIGKAAAKHEH